ncbi:MAG: hypothetical protein DMF69_08655 [Acidobacteria bacterium]|nr:MAG: hypothetical protein DMF69_08655 [Acidobacteriota bacterium]
MGPPHPELKHGENESFAKGALACRDSNITEIEPECPTNLSLSIFRAARQAKLSDITVRSLASWNHDKLKHIGHLNIPRNQHEKVGRPKQSG